LKSIVKKESYHCEGDFFFYGLGSIKEFVKEAKKEKALVIVGFSFCQKPLECPASRFSDKCIADPDHAVCRQCDIGKVLHALPEKKAIPLLIPTVHYIGEKIFEMMEKHRDRELIFMITACEMSLRMFGDFGNMMALKGIGVRLGGRICNTMRAFELAEEGTKPGLTLVLPDTQSEILALMREIRNSISN
ncbi:MAG: hypothetical protein K1000chlam4_00881, partial [Chlamydiae bacterium]|nr:hypothetical protein [Chlamydiota bacterium]